MPDDHTFTTKACGSATAVNKTLQTEDADAFLAMQAATAKDGVTIWMQSGYRSVDYQKNLYEDVYKRQARRRCVQPFAGCAPGCSSQDLSLIHI